MVIDVDVALDTWARWSKRVLAGLGYPAINIIARIVRYGILGAARQLGTRVTEVDDLAELVERAVLTRLDEQEQEIVRRHYCLPEPDYISADQMGIDPRRFSEKLADAKRSVEDYLSGAVESRINVA